MNRLVGITLAFVALATGAVAGDLYRVGITSETEADLVRNAGVEPAYRVNGGYLVLVDDAAAKMLKSAGISLTVLAADITADRLAIDNRLDRANVGRFDLVYEDGGLRIFRVDDISKISADVSSMLFPIGNDGLQIIYRAPQEFYAGFSPGQAPLDSLIGLVSQDTVTAYLERLQAFTGIVVDGIDTTITGRLTGTDSNYAARDWIAERFISYGLDSVVLDSFTGQQLGDGAVPAFNVIGYKTGSRYPGRHIIVGGHFDAVRECPGADDNGTGATGTLEIARVLAGIETEMTLIFITFDSEESGLHGSKHYAEAAAARGDTIVYMLNMDMIGHETNSTQATLYLGTGDEPYALLWGKLADSLVGITGILSGQSGNSDHAPFAQRGYDVTFVHEYFTSTHYHSRTDSTTYINFDYMTRMIQASLATAYSVNIAPPPVIITLVRDVGDGQSLEVNWVPGDPTRISHFWLHWTTVPATTPDSQLVPVDSSRWIIPDLAEGQKYSMHMIAVDQDGRTSIAFQRAYGTPYSKPALPAGLAAYPLPDSIRLVWLASNTELDFHHYRVIRDGGMIADSIFGTTYVDDDPAIDSILHDYLVVAVDTSGYISDTVGVPPVSMKAATLAANRILAVNRSASNTQAFVNEVITGELIREALTGWDFEYYSDTSFDNPDRVGLLNMIDYGLVVVGAESGGNQDDIEGILDELGYYLSIGGKAVIFGRWGGEIKLDYDVDSVFYSPDGPRSTYLDYFNTVFRIQPISRLNMSPVILESDFVGAHSQHTDYPDLTWDEQATDNHTGILYDTITGIPCPSIPVLYGTYEVLYTYNSSTDSALTEGRPIAWRHLGSDHSYVYLDIPLSFMQRAEAVMALQQAVTDMGIVSDIDDEPRAALPTMYLLTQNHPNPFNARTTIEFYNPRGRQTPVTLEVFNILGQRVRVLFDGPAVPGRNQVEWDGRDDSNRPVATGIYLYRLTAGEETSTRKMLLLK